MINVHCNSKPTKSKSQSKALYIRGRVAKRVITSKAFDWLTLMIRGLGHLDEAACVFSSNGSYSYPFTIKDHTFLPFTNNASLDSQFIIFHSLHFLHTLPKSNPFLHKWPHVPNPNTSSTNLIVEVHATTVPIVGIGHIWLTICRSVQKQAYVDVRDVRIYWSRCSYEKRDQQF